ncbi:unnamed protein product, partial [Cyprideis torosa]
MPSICPPTCLFPSTMNPTQRKVTADWLALQLRRSEPTVFVVDCRNASDFHRSHIRGSINITVPTLLLKRLVNKKITLESVIKCCEDRTRFYQACNAGLTIVIVSDAEGTTDMGSATLVLMKRLIDDGHDVSLLQDPFKSFRASFPEWCEESAPSVPLVGLESLRISSVDSVDSAIEGGCSGHRSSSLDEGAHEEDEEEGSQGGFPVEIISGLFLGNARNSEDHDMLDARGIKYILNVTPTLPNVFQESGSFKYMQIPISDHWSENLSNFFAQAIDFIG